MFVVYRSVLRGVKIHMRVARYSHSLVLLILKEGIITIRSGPAQARCDHRSA
jgi:hypothetical protein